MDHARGVPAVEGLQALADPGAAAGALRHDREPVERARGVLLLHRVGDMGEPGVEQERLGLAKLVEHAVDEAQEHAGVHAHRAGGVEQHDEPQRLFLALPLDEVDRHAAMADIAVNGPAQIEPVAAPPRQIAPRQPRAHRPRQPRGGVMRLLDLRGIGQLAEIHLGQIVGARGAFHAAFAGAIGAGHRRWMEPDPSPPRRRTRWPSARLLSDGLFAAFDEPMSSSATARACRARTRRKMPSNFSQSDLRAENRCLNAERNRPGLAA